MSVDHSPHHGLPTHTERPLFLDLNPGMTVIVRHDPMPGEPHEQDWWMGLVLHCNGGARDPRAYTLFQIADIDSGVIRWVNADLITNVLQGEGGHA